MRIVEIASVLLAIVACPLTASAQPQMPRAAVFSTDEADHQIVFEIGVAGDWSRREGFSPGGTAAFEVNPVEGRLELEAGVTVIRTATGTERPIDLLFKKPWRISRQFEFMIGAGPELIHAIGSEHGTF